MEAVIVVIVLAVLVFLVLLALEPPSTQQRTTEVKGKIEVEKKQAMAEIDAVTNNHKRQIFELLAEANRQIVEEQAEQALRHAREAVARAAKET